MFSGLGLLGSVVGTVLNLESADAQNDAIQASTDAQTALYERIYDEQTALNQPLIDFRDSRLGMLDGLRGYSADGTQTNAFGPTDDAMNAFYASPEYQVALNGFEQQGDNWLANQAAIGNLYSGATMKGLSDIERNNAFNAYGTYYGNLMGEAGFGQTGAQNQSTASQNYGTMVGNALGTQGLSNATAAGQRYSAYGNALTDISNTANYAAGMIFGG